MGGEADSGAGRSGWLVRVALPLAVVVALTGCGPDRATPGSGGLDGPSGTTDGVGRAAPPSGATDGVGRVAPPSGRPADALAKWRSFPVTADPRPLILTRGSVIHPATGFPTDGAKLAYAGGNFELASTVPAAPATSAGYAIVSAMAALDRLRATGSPQPGTRPLRIVDVSLVQTAFGTDRGPRVLPAWRFQLDQVRDPVQILAVDSRYLWRWTAGGHTGMDHHASLAGDGRSLTFSFYGSPAGPSPCGADYTADVAESRTAAVVTPRRITPNPLGSTTSQVCTTMAFQRTVTVRLAAPLGARVLLTPEGLPVPVDTHP